MDWAVYDLNADDVIGVWDSYYACVLFCLDNQDDKDNWEIFPGYECYVPVRGN